MFIYVYLINVYLSVKYKTIFDQFAENIFGDYVFFNFILSVKIWKLGKR